MFCLYEIALKNDIIILAIIHVERICSLIAHILDFLFNMFVFYDII